MTYHEQMMLRQQFAREINFMEMERRIQAHWFAISVLMLFDATPNGAKEGPRRNR